MNKKNLVNISLFSSVLTILVLSVNVQAATKMYKWVDAQGRISYQDKPPPRNSKILSEETLESKKSSTSGKKLNTTSIDVYVTADCPSCDTTVDLLKTWGVPHQVKSIENARDIQTILIEKTNGVRVPALFTDGQLITGTSGIENLKTSLTNTGHIDPNSLSEGDTNSQSGESEQVESN